MDIHRCRHCGSSGPMHLEGSRTTSTCANCRRKQIALAKAVRRNSDRERPPPPPRPAPKPMTAAERHALIAQAHAMAQRLDMPLVAALQRVGVL